MDASIEKSILILEDDPLIALDHDECAERAGFTTVTMLTTCAEAEDWLQLNTPSVALIDVKLRDGPFFLYLENLIPTLEHFPPSSVRMPLWRYRRKRAWWKLERIGVPVACRQRVLLK